MKDRTLRFAKKYSTGIVMFWKKEPGGWTQKWGQPVNYFQEAPEGFHMMYLPRSAFEEFRLFGMWIAVRR